MIFGLILGIAGYYTPNVEMGANLIEAIFIGLSAGAAATGVNQVGKQLGKDEEEDMSSIILYIKKFIDSVEVLEDDEEEISCDENLEDDIPEDTSDTEDDEDISEEDVPSDEISDDNG